MPTMLLRVMVTTNLVAGLVLGAQPKVTITGGADESGHNYAWTVTNNSQSRLVYIEFPHYSGDLFNAPEKWKQELENRRHYGWQDRMGAAKAWPEPSYPGLAPAMSAKFGLRIAAAGALRGTGTVLVKFEDGSQEHVSGVELPVKPEQGSNYLALAGAAIIFFGFVFVREYRRRKHGPPPQDDDFEATT